MSGWFNESIGKADYNGWRERFKRQHETETYCTNLFISDHETTVVTVVVSTCLVYYFSGYVL